MFFDRFNFLCILLPGSLPTSPMTAVVPARERQQKRAEGSGRECGRNVFELDSEGLITHMRLYLQQPGGTAPVGGRDAMGDTGGQ